MTADGLLRQSTGVSSGRRASFASDATRRSSIVAHRRSSVHRKRQSRSVVQEKALSSIWHHTLSDIGKSGLHSFSRTESDESRETNRFPTVQSPSIDLSQGHISIGRSSPEHEQTGTAFSPEKSGKDQKAARTTVVVSPYLSVVAPVGLGAGKSSHQVHSHDGAMGYRASRGAGPNPVQQTLKSTSIPSSSGRVETGKSRVSTSNRRASTMAEWEEQNQIKQAQAQERHRSDQWLLAREAERGNAFKVLEMLQAGIEASSVDEAGRTPCHFAAVNNHQQAILALCFVDQDSYLPHDFEQQAKDGGTALHYAAFNGCFQAVDTLIQQHRRKIQKDRTDILNAHKEKLQETQRQLKESRARHRELEEEVEGLHQQHAELNQTIQDCRSATVDGKADFAKRRRDLRERQKALEGALDQQAEACKKLEQAVAHWKPISRAKHEAFKASLAAALKELAAAQAALQGHVKEAEQAEKDHAKAMRKNARGDLKAQKALQRVEAALPDRTQELAASEAGLQALRRQKTAVRDDVKEYSRRVVVFPSDHTHIEFNAVVHGRGADGATPLHWAAESGQDGVAKALIEQGADVNAVDAEGMTALHWAAGARADARLVPMPRPLRRHVEVGVVLLSAGAAVDAVDGGGWTAMHVAAEGGFSRFVRMLKEWGADAKAASAEGQLPAHLALGGGHLECAEALLHEERDLLATVHRPDANGLSPLQLATLSGRAQEAVALVKRCTLLLEGNTAASRTAARRGLRDEPHKTTLQSYGAQIFTGSVAESLQYGQKKLAATRTSGWARNDLIHVGTRTSVPVGQEEAAASTGRAPKAPSTSPSRKPLPGSLRSLALDSKRGFASDADALHDPAATWTEGLSEATRRAIGILE